MRLRAWWAVALPCSAVDRSRVMQLCLSIRLNGRIVGLSETGKRLCGAVDFRASGSLIRNQKQGPRIDLRRE